MRSEVVLQTAGKVRSYGTVKWFGGLNNKTGRENHFGFISDLNGKDIFLHKGEWLGACQPAEGQLVTYLQQERDDKFSAHQAESLDSAKIRAPEWYSALCNPPLNTSKFAPSDLQEAIEEKLRRSLDYSNQADLHELLELSQQPGAPSVFALVANDMDAAKNYLVLMEAARLSITDAAPWAGLSHCVASHFETEIASRLGSLEPQIAREKCTDFLTVLPVSILTYLLTRGIFTTTDQLGSASVKKIYDYVSSVIARGTSTFPDYLRASFDTSLVTPNGRPSNPILRDIVDNLQFKKSLFEKSTEFTDIYNASARLQRNVETFILNHLLGLVVAGNDHQVVYSVFMQRLWEALMLNALPLEHRTAQLQSLFPSCTMMGPKLSCEAVYWSKQNLFLCRGKRCISQKILPNLTRHFLDFNIYDWLSHYGVNYMLSDKPQDKDFPIKLASYFNRLREILPVLHCRACCDLMLPNMKYARTQYKEVVRGVIEIKEMAAAYRLTVFHCNNANCEEFNVGHYISHCVGFGCSHIVDSRDLKQRCSEGRYVCQGCGSCCPSHAQSHPVGICAECGDELEVLSERVRGRQSTYSRKYVKCKSASCSFTILSEDLPAKFSLLPA
ncbi:cold shock CspA family protein [Comamonas sp. BIGb0152]|uniref:cold-shock protein n=1 Tax=Comamonas sp. BIGb0152 TaxID=2940601 RepID=UPI002169C994|nr:cold shock domain-containing protein [Comamonas sp. BIGb0152]MCS4293765.1 cold shock CspA family protein [Comamonas sp. BIGb0152]